MLTDEQTDALVIVRQHAKELCSLLRKKQREVEEIQLELTMIRNTVLYPDVDFPQNARTV